MKITSETFVFTLTLKPAFFTMLYFKLNVRLGGIENSLKNNYSYLLWYNLFSLQNVLKFVNLRQKNTDVR